MRMVVTFLIRGSLKCVALLWFMVRHVMMHSSIGSSFFAICDATRSQEGGKILCRNFWARDS